MATEQIRKHLAQQAVIPEFSAAQINAAMADYSYTDNRPDSTPTAHQAAAVYPTNEYEDPYAHRSFVDYLGTQHAQQNDPFYGGDGKEDDEDYN